jgi:hypothetical protein
VSTDLSFVVYSGEPISQGRLRDLFAVPGVKAIRHSPHAFEQNLSAVAAYTAVPQAPVDDPRRRSSTGGFKVLRAQAETLPDVDGDPPELARAVSRLAGTAWWLCLGGHQGKGGFARFDGGEPADDANIWITGDGWAELPAQFLAEDLGWFEPVGLEELFERAFPKAVVLITERGQRLPFDAKAWEISLA